VSGKNLGPYTKNISFQIRRRGLKRTKDLILIICKSERDHNLLRLVIHTLFFLLFWKAFLGFLGAGESSFTTTGISGIASSFNAVLAPGYPSSASLAGSLLYWLFVKCFPHILLYFEGVKF
jgi:hypothetical protein